jgi:GT2 family glycosyltransferase
MDLSIVIVSWNTRALTLDCLASLEQALTGTGSVEGCEVLVVDNASSDGTAAAIAAQLPAVRVIASPRNLGFAAGCNAALRVATGRHVLFLNSDARIDGEAIRGCVDYLDRQSDVAVVGPQLLHPDGRRRNSIHNAPTLTSELVPKPLLQFLFRRRFPSHRWIGEQPLDVEAVTGAAFFVRSAAIADVGPLPEDYFLFLEETDWCLRMRRAGWRVVHLPALFAVHVAGASSKLKDPALTRIEYHRSLYHYFRVNRGMGSMATVFTLRLFKTLVYLMLAVPAALLGSERSRARLRMHGDVLAWHLRGCPRSVGFAAASQSAASAAPDPGR